MRRGSRPKRALLLVLGVALLLPAVANAEDVSSPTNGDGSVALPPPWPKDRQILSSGSGVGQHFPVTLIATGYRADAIYWRQESTGGSANAVSFPNDPGAYYFIPQNDRTVIPANCVNSWQATLYGNPGSLYRC